MFGAIVQWLLEVPLGQPWRAAILVLEVIAYAFILHLLWELVFKVTGANRRGKHAPPPSH